MHHWLVMCISIFQLSSSLGDDLGSSRVGVSVRVGSGWGSDGSVNSDGGGSNGGGSLDMVGVSDDWGSLGPLDDGLSLDSDGDGDIVRGINMNWGGDLDNLVGGEGSVIGSIVGLVDKDGLLDVVDLLDVLDDGSVDGLGSLEDSWDLDGEMRGGGLQDSGGISGDIVGLAIVDLLGDNGGGLVDGGHTLGLLDGGVGSRGGGGHVLHGVLDHGSGAVVLRSVGGDGSCGGSSNSCHSWSSCIAGSNSWSCHGVGGGTIGTSQDKSQSHLEKNMFNINAYDV